MAKEKFIILDFNKNYAISNYGNVMNVHTKRILIPQDKGYLFVTLHNVSNTRGNKGYRKQYRIHRLVARYFIDNPYNKPYVNHKDGNKHNNHVENLEWVTESENTTHAYKKGLISTQKPIKATNLVDNSIIEVFESLSECARYFNCNKAYIHRALNKTYGKNIYKGYKFEYINCQNIKQQRMLQDVTNESNNPPKSSEHLNSNEKDDDVR